MDLGDGKEEDIEEEGQENVDENQDELFMEHGTGTGISDDRKFKKNTSEENLKNKNEAKKNIRNVVGEKEEKPDQMNTSSHNSSVASQTKYSQFII